MPTPPWRHRKIQNLSSELKSPYTHLNHNKSILGVLLHTLPKCRPERGVHGRGQPRDHGAGVDDGATGGEGGGGDSRELGAANGDADDVETVEGVVAGDYGQRSVYETSIGGGGSAEGEVAKGAGGGGETVGENFVVIWGGLLDNGNGVAAEAHEAGGAIEEALIVLAAAEEEVVDDVGGGDGKALLTQEADGGGIVTVFGVIYAWCICGWGAFWLNSCMEKKN